MLAALSCSSLVIFTVISLSANVWNTVHDVFAVQLNLRANGLIDGEPLGRGRL